MQFRSSKNCSQDIKLTVFITNNSILKLQGH